MNINYNHIKDEYKSLIDRVDSSYDIEDGIQEERRTRREAHARWKDSTRYHEKAPGKQTICVCVKGHAGR